MTIVAPIDHEPDLMTLAELAERMGWSYSQAYEAARANQLPIPVIRIGRRYMFSRRAYEAVLEARHEPQGRHTA